MGAKVAASSDAQPDAEPAATVAQNMTTGTGSLGAENAEIDGAPRQVAVKPEPELGFREGAQATSQTGDPPAVVDSREGADDGGMDAAPGAASPSDAESQAAEMIGARADASQEIATQSEDEAAAAGEDKAEDEAAAAGEDKAEDEAAAPQSSAASVAEADGAGGALSPVDAAFQNGEGAAVASDVAVAAATVLAAAQDNAEAMPPSPSGSGQDATVANATELPAAGAPDEHPAGVSDALVADEQKGPANHTPNKPAGSGVKPANGSSKKDKVTKSAKRALSAETSSKVSAELQKPAAKKTKPTRILPNFDAYKPYGSTDSRKRSARDTPSPDLPAKPAAKKTALICISSDESEDDDDVTELAEPAVPQEHMRLEQILRRPPPPPGHDFHPFASSLALVRAAWLSGLE